MSGTIITILPDGSETIEHWAKSGSPSLQRLQHGVGGYIERVKVRYKTNWETTARVRDAYVNENGIMEGLQFNRKATLLTQGTIFEGVQLVGPVVIWIPDPKAKPSKVQAG